MSPPAAFAQSFTLGPLNRFLYWSSGKLLWQIIQVRINKWREQTLGLPSQRDYIYQNIPQLCMFSELVVPRPSDWPKYVHHTGYWTLPAKDNYVPSQELSDFLSNGETPVYFGFGSMPVMNPTELIQHIIEALSRVGMIGILSASWIEEIRGPTIPSHLLLIKGAPHEWLFPKCSIICHHGGSGTTGASLRAGKPTIVFSVLMDQPYWGARIAALGVGPQTVIPLKELTVVSLESQLRLVTPDMKKKAAEIGERLRKEPDGATKAVQLIADYFKQKHNCGIVMTWLQDESAADCMECKKPFTFLNRRHHCRSCGWIFCLDCLALAPVPNWGEADQMTCKKCFYARSLLLKPE